MVTLGVIVVDELAEELAQVPFPEATKVFEAFCADRPDESFGVRVAVRAARRNWHSLDAGRCEPLCPSLGEERVAFVDEVGGVPQKTIDQIQQISGYLLHPGAIGRDAGAGDDLAGNWRDSVYSYELAADDEQNRIEFDEYYVEGRFTIVREERDAQRARDAWHCFEPR